ncbi:Zinc finger protein 701 [Plecturocebus cupreus]
MGFLYVGRADLELLTSGDPPLLASQSAGITGWVHGLPADQDAQVNQQHAPHDHKQFLVLDDLQSGKEWRGADRWEFHYVGQTGLELLTSIDLPVSASQTAGITGSFQTTELPLSLMRFVDCCQTVGVFLLGSHVREHKGQFLITDDHRDESHTSTKEPSLYFFQTRMELSPMAQQLLNQSCRAGGAPEVT